MDRPDPILLDVDALFAEADAATIDEASLKAEADKLLVVSNLLARKGRIGEALAMARLARMQFAALAARRRLEPKPPRPPRPTDDLAAWWDKFPLSHGRPNPYRAPRSEWDPAAGWTAPAERPAPDDDDLDSDDALDRAAMAELRRADPTPSPRKAALTRLMRDNQKLYDSLVADPDRYRSRQELASTSGSGSGTAPRPP